MGVEGGNVHEECVGESVVDGAHKVSQELGAALIPVDNGLGVGIFIWFGFGAMEDAPGGDLKRFGIN